MKNKERGSALGDVVMLVTLCIIIFLFIIPAEKGRPPQRDFSRLLGDTIGSPESGSLDRDSVYPGSQWVADLNTDSPYSGEISVDTGNASYTYEPDAEYVTVRNNSGSPINITGWTLKNAKDRRVYTLGNNIQNYPADTLTIPQGALYVSPAGPSYMRDIILAPGEQAIVVTGRPPANTTYRMVSFKENKCSGYLGNSRSINFQPPLSDSCLRPSSEAGSSQVDKECQNFIRRMPSCHTPQYDTVINREVCRGCADDVLLSSQCIAYLKTHFNYESCIANHSSDSDFSLKTWRVYLGRSWEMWNSEQEVISLIDSSGRLVDFKSY